MYEFPQKGQEEKPSIYLQIPTIEFIIGREGEAREFGVLLLYSVQV